MAGVTVEDLRKVPTLADLPGEDLAWIAERSTLIELQPGETLAKPGDEPDWMHILIEGDLHMRPDEQERDRGRLYVIPSGSITGMLPHSRMKRLPRHAYAGTPLRVAAFPKADFPELRSRIPLLHDRLIDILLDRKADTIRGEDQNEKLASLGRLSAGLAHQLNNPAAAARRAAAALRSAFDEAEDSIARLTAAVGVDLVKQLVAMRQDLVRNHHPKPLSTLERADREESLAAWLEGVGVPEPWRLAPTLVESGVDIDWLSGFVAPIAPDARDEAIQCLELHLRANDILRTVEDASDRISRLIHDFKQYTYMDRAQVQEIDVHEGIENTIKILANKLDGITVRREYASDLPRIAAYGADLNQVWTNILDNAADALGGEGEIVIKTWKNGDNLSVEIRDSGPGMPPEVASRAFDPFFTTKGVGAGTGLGLDIARRVVEDQHRGKIHLQSVPGATSFRIELPMRLEIR